MKIQHCLDHVVTHKTITVDWPTALTPLSPAFDGHGIYSAYIIFEMVMESFKKEKVFNLRAGIYLAHDVQTKGEKEKENSWMKNVFNRIGFFIKICQITRDQSSGYESSLKHATNNLKTILIWNHHISSKMRIWYMMSCISCICSIINI